MTDNDDTEGVTDSVVAAFMFVALVTAFVIWNVIEPVYRAAKRVVDWFKDDD